MDATKQERERLIRTYAGMSDGELEKIAGEAAGLTDVARQVLADEIGRRGLLLEAAPVSDETSAEPESAEGLVTIREFRDLHEALLAQGALQAAGIECSLADDNMIRLDWFISNLLGGVKLRVRHEDVEPALEVLEQDIPEAFDVEGVGAYEQPACPKCQSLDITFEKFSRGIGLTTVFVLALPVHIPENKWKCHSCGHEWQDTQAAEND